MACTSPWDPTALGAACNLCPLRTEREGDPVPGEILPGTAVMGVGQEPGDAEVRSGRPLCGPSGRIFDQALVVVGRHRRLVSTTNVVACKPPGGDIVAYEAKLASRNRKRARQGLGPIPSPTACCAPRLHAELRGFNYLLPMGSVALAATTPFVRGGVGRNRGRLIEIPVGLGYDPTDRRIVPGRRVVATFNAAAVARDMVLWKVFTRDLDRLFRWSEGALRPPVIETFYRPDMGLLQDLLTRRFFRWRGLFAHIYDVETQSIHAMKARLRCIGIGGPEWAVVVPYEPVQWERARVAARKSAEERAAELVPNADGVLPWSPVVNAEGFPLDGVDPPQFDPYYTLDDGIAPLYTAEEQAERDRLIRWWATEPSILKVGWNCLYGGTPILLANGTSAPIDRLVRGRFAGEVLGMNAAGEVVPAQVLGWFRETRPGQTWLVIRCVGEKGHARGLTLTPDHEVYLTRGRVSAAEVQPGDFMLTAERELVADQQAAILGTLLGDSVAAACTSKPGAIPGQPVPVRIDMLHASRAALRGSHSSQALAQEKAEWLSGWLTVTSEQSVSFGKPRTAFVYRTPQCRQIADLARLVYSNGKRRLKVEALDRLGPVGLAWLFADDGFQTRRRPGKRGRVRRSPVSIATCGFPRTDLELGAAWFSRTFGYTSISSKGCLLLSIDATRAFCQYIAPYLLPAARYKLPDPRGWDLDAWPEFIGMPARAWRPHPVEVVSVSSWVPPREGTQRWCLRTTTGNFMTGFGLVKNCGSYDRLTMENPVNGFRLTPAPHMDGILVKRNVSPELNHDLGFTVSLLLDMEDWKGDHVAVHAQTDSHLWRYNGQGDIGATGNVIEPLYAELESRGQVEVCRLDHQIQAIGVGMHKNGLLVDQVARVARDHELRRRVGKWLTHTRQLIDKLGVRVSDVTHRTKKADEQAEAMRREVLDTWAEVGLDPTGLSEDEIRDGWDLPSAAAMGLDALGFNPLSHAQLRSVLFDEWELPIPTDMKPRELYTQSGEISTGDAVLRRLVIDRSIPEDHRRFIHAVRMLRRWAKEWGTYVVPLRLPTGRAKLDRGCVVWEDGRVHSVFNTHSVKSGRISTSSPNCQNEPPGIKALFVPGPGHRFIGPDMDQIEMRIAASRWNVRALLEAFDQGLDPYQYVMRLILGEERRAALIGGPSAFGKKDFKKKSPYERARKLYKAVHLACVDRETEVVTLGPEGAKPICQVRPGDWTWAWSTRRRRYEPARVLGTICQGVKPAVRVHFRWWAGARAGWREGSVVATVDHQFMLRDGTFREAGSLSVGASLMPFRRREYQGYRHVMPYNTGEERREHRIAVGLYEMDENAHVHHENHTRTDNRLENLRILTPTEHLLQEHPEILAKGQAAARTASKARSFEDRSRAATISWDTRRAKVAAGQYDPAFGPRASLLDAFADQIGILPDQEVADLAGCTFQNVAAYRATRGIPAPAPRVGARGWLKAVLQESPWREQLESAQSCEEIAQGLSRSYGIAVTRQAVLFHRKKLAPHNHEVVSVEPVGLREVWDLEVDHEDHNFATAAGVFVHNCQYGATLETAYRLVTSDEDKETGNLVFKDLPIEEFAVTYTRWGEGFPEYAAGWAAAQAKVRFQGFLQEPVLGRRRDFPNGAGGNLSEMTNTEIQPAAASILNILMAEVEAEVPHGYAGPGTGLVNQVHDQLLLEVPEGDVPRVRGILDRIMNGRTFEGLPGVRFTADVGDEKGAGTWAAA